LAKRGVIIIPDIIANAGGVIVSYLEWLQNKRGEKWSEELVNKKLEGYMKKAVKEMVETANTQKISFKEAAFEIAIKKLIS